MRFIFYALLLLPLFAPAADENLLQTGAIPGGSSFFGVPNRSTVTVDTRNYFTAVADNDPVTGWRPMESRGPHYLEFRWRTPVKINRFKWDTGEISLMQISYWNGMSFLPVTQLSGMQGEKTIPEITTDRIRIDLVQFTGTPNIFEFGAFGPPQPLPPATIPDQRSTDSLTVNSAVFTPAQAAPGDTVTLTLTLATLPPTGSYLLAELKRLGSNAYFRNEFGDWDLCAQTVPMTGKTLTTQFVIPAYAPSGTIPLQLTALSADGKSQIPLTKPATMPGLTINRTDPPAPAPAECPGLQLGEVGGQHGFQLGNEFKLPFFFRYMCSADYERFFNSEPSGINLQYFLLYAGCIRPEAGQQQFFDRLDQQITAMLSVRPDSFFLIGMDLRPDGNWRQLNQTELMLKHDGTPALEGTSTLAPVSFGSAKYLNDCYQFIDRLIAFLDSKPYRNRIVGFHPWTNTRNDAFIGGIENNRGVKDRTKIFIGDFNPGALNAFRDWLRVKYDNSEAALRQAWRDPAVTFATARPNGAALAGEDYPSGVFRNQVQSRAEIDYIEFFPSLIGSFHRKLAARLKAATNRKALVMVHYGAILHNLVADQPSGARSHANNFDFADVLRDDNIDCYVQSMPYHLRHAGDPVVTLQPIESLNLNRRMYLVDYDIRSLNSGTLKYGRHRSRYETEALVRRDLSWLLLKNAGAWLADMSKYPWNRWEEYRKPWFSAPEVLEPIRDTLDQVGKLKRVRQNGSEIAVVISTHTPPREDTMNTSAIYRNLVTLFLQQEMTKLGTPYDIILTDDLAKPELTEYKLYIFLNTFYLTPDEKMQIQNLKRDGKTLCWFYAPGYLTDSGFDSAALSQLTGISVSALTATPQKLQMRVQSTSSPLTANLAGTDFIAESWPGATHLHPTEIQPVFRINDPQAQTLATAPDGSSAWAARDFGAWKSVYSTVPLLNTQAVRNLARYAGVHLYCDEDIIMGADNRMLMFHNGYDRARTITIRLPQPETITDTQSGQVLCRNAREFSLQLTTPETKLLKREERLQK